jgi:hypothetical protein
MRLLSRLWDEAGKQDIIWQQRFEFFASLGFDEAVRRVQAMEHFTERGWIVFVPKQGGEIYSQPYEFVLVNSQTRYVTCYLVGRITADVAGLVRVEGVTGADRNEVLVRIIFPLIVVPILMWSVNQLCLFFPLLS